MKVIISTDAHDPQHFKLMRYGVTTARRGWMEKSGVLNTLPPEKLLASLRKVPNRCQVPGIRCLADWLNDLTSIGQLVTSL